MTRRTKSRGHMLRMADDIAAFTDLGFDTFFPGLHVSVVDTLLASPRELLAFTVDYIQFVKKEGRRDVDFFVHHLQFDDFTDSDQSVLGPFESGLNSQRDSLADARDFQSRSWLHIRLEGPADPRIPIFDANQGVLTLKAAMVFMRPLEVHLDAPRLLHAADRLAGWTKSAIHRDRGIAGEKNPAAIDALVRILAPGLAMPRRGPDTTSCVTLLHIGSLALRAHVRLRPRPGSEDAEEGAGDDGDILAAGIEAKLSMLTARLWPPLRVFVDSVFRMGASVAEVSPSLSFREVVINHVNSGAAPLVASLSAHYKKQVVSQSFRVIGSVQVLGDPANLFDQLGSSVVTFVKKTGQEVSGQRDTLGEGFKDLTGGVVGGVCGSVSKISGALKGAIAGITGETVGTHKKRASSLAEGLDQGLSSIADGVSAAISGLLEEPMEQMHEDGSIGFLKGSAHGVIGLVTRPLEGALGAVERIAQGIEGQVRSDHRSYGGLRRPPRVDFENDRQLVQSVGLLPLDQGFFWPSWRLRVVRISLPLIWKTREVRELSVSLAQGGKFLSRSEVLITRAARLDSWALGASMIENIASGRVGCLRGPFRLQVDALVESNLEMTEPFRVTVGYGWLPTRMLLDALSLPFGMTSNTMTFEVKAERSSFFDLLLSEGVAVEDIEAPIGQVTIDLARDTDAKILPKTLMRKAIEATEARISQAGRLLKDSSQEEL